MTSTPLKFTLAASLIACEGAARADQASYPMDFVSCTGALAQVAARLQLPLTLAQDTADRKVYLVPAKEGSVAMVCDRVQGTLTVVTPQGQPIDPYVQQGKQQ